jgi:hypothetical protein
MHERMNQHQQYQHNGADTPSNYSATAKKPDSDKVGDYIDFEEIK